MVDERIFLAHVSQYQSYSRPHAWSPYELKQRPDTGPSTAAMQVGTRTDLCCTNSYCRASSDGENNGGVESGGGAWRVQSAVIFLSHPIHHIHESLFSTQREMAIKAKMPNYAWLSAIKDSTAAKFRGHLQRRGPFSAIAELSAVICCSIAQFREGRKEKKKRNLKKINKYRRKEH